MLPGRSPLVLLTVCGKDGTGCDERVEDGLPLCSGVGLGALLDFLHSDVGDVEGLDSGDVPRPSVLVDEEITSSEVDIEPVGVFGQGWGEMADGIPACSGTDFLPTVSSRSRMKASDVFSGLSDGKCLSSSTSIVSSGVTSGTRSLEESASKSRSYVSMDSLPSVSSWRGEDVRLLELPVDLPWLERP